VWRTATNNIELSESTLELTRFREPHGWAEGTHGAKSHRPYPRSSGQRLID